MIPWIDESKIQPPPRAPASMYSKIKNLTGSAAQSSGQPEAGKATSAAVNEAAVLKSQKNKEAEEKRKWMESCKSSEMKISFNTATGRPRFNLNIPLPPQSSSMPSRAKKKAKKN